jgi:predicted nucleotidyltransferase
MATALASLTERALPILRQYGVRRAGVFGSYARDQAEPESDLDLLVELPLGSSLLDLVGLEQELTDELGLRVEATTYRALHPLLRERVLADEKTIL